LHHARLLAIASAKLPIMSNRAIWNVRQRHEWLRTPLKGKSLKRRKRLRIGLEQALERKRRSQRAGAGESGQTEG
jgi:hypothetical protein